MGGVGESIAEGWENVKREATKGWRGLIGADQAEAQRRAVEEAQRKAQDIEREQRRIADELRARLPEAERTLQEQYGKAREQMQSALGRTLGQLAIGQAQQSRLLSRAGMMGFQSSGALENAFRASSEALAGAGLRGFASVGAGLAQLEASLGERLASLPLSYIQGEIQALGLLPSYYSSIAQLASTQPPSLFDRLIQAGALIALASGNPAAMAAGATTMAVTGGK